MKLDDHYGEKKWHFGIVICMAGGRASDDGCWVGLLIKTFSIDTKIPMVHEL